MACFCGDTACPSCGTAQGTYTPPRRVRCDGCGKMRRDVQSVGRDAHVDPDAPDLCFLCRAEAHRRVLGRGR